MALVPAICTQCGATVEVDNTHEAGICKFCGTAFIIEKAINKYTTNIINNNNFAGANINVVSENVDIMLDNIESLIDKKLINEAEDLLKDITIKYSYYDRVWVVSEKFIYYKYIVYEKDFRNEEISEWLHNGMDKIRLFDSYRKKNEKQENDFFDKYETDCACIKKNMNEYLYSEEANLEIDSLGSHVKLLYYDKHIDDKYPISEKNGTHSEFYSEFFEACKQNMAKLNWATNERVIEEYQFLSCLLSQDDIERWKIITGGILGFNGYYLTTSTYTYKTIIQVRDNIDKIIEESSNKAKRGGCYVATCVYGSYDCPEVWTLRRYRDYTLDCTWYGRMFIKCYYTISPIIVKLFGKKQWFKVFWKKHLDKLVVKLNKIGIESTEYIDKY